MPRIANLEISHHVGAVGIYSDLAHLPEDEQVKRSITRARNQASAERRRNGEVKPRGKRSSTVSKAPAKSLLSKLGLADSEAAKGLHAAHLEEVRLHDEKLWEFTKAHAAEREELEKAHEAKLGSVGGLIRMLDMAKQLPDNSKLVADLEKRLANF